VTSASVFFSVMYCCSMMPLCASHSSLVYTFGALLCGRGGTCGGGGRNTDGTSGGGNMESTSGGGNVEGTKGGGKTKGEAVASGIS
jgi:hypothetical protein